MSRFDGRVAIVTGAAAGIGRGIAQRFGSEGAHVWVVDRHESDAAATAREIAATGAAAHAVVADVSREADVQHMVAEVTSEHGRVDILVNNAGVNEHAPVANMSLEKWTAMIDGNLTATFLCSREVIAGMAERGSGRIVNIGSQLGELGGAGMAHYTAAKAGIHGFTKALARELAPTGITVNAVAPGPVATENLASLASDLRRALKAEIPLGRFGTVAEIVPLVLLLASDEGSYCTGAVVKLSGGHWM